MSQSEALDIQKILKKEAVWTAEEWIVIADAVAAPLTPEGANSSPSYRLSLEDIEKIQRRYNELKFPETERSLLQHFNFLGINQNLQTQKALLSETASQKTLREYLESFSEKYTNEAKKLGKTTLSLDDFRSEDWLNSFISSEMIEGIFKEIEEQKQNNLDNIQTILSKSRIKDPQQHLFFLQLMLQRAKDIPDFKWTDKHKKFFSQEIKDAFKTQYPNTTTALFRQAYELAQKNSQDPQSSVFFIELIYALKEVVDHYRKNRQIHQEIKSSLKLPSQHQTLMKGSDKNPREKKAP